MLGIGVVFVATKVLTYPHAMLAVVWITPITVAVEALIKRPAVQQVQGFKREIRALWSFLAPLITVNFILISLPLPTYRIDASLAPNEHLLDLHAHSTLSDGFLSPSQRADWYRSQGIDIPILTDHDHVGGEPVKGQEYTSRDPDIHLNVFGVAQQYDPRQTAPVALIADVKQRGGFLIVNHYTDDAATPRPFTPESLAELGVDGFEIINGWGEMRGRGGEALRALCLERHLACVSGSDEHQNREIRQFMRIGLPEHAGTSAAELFAALKRNRQQVVEIATSPLPELPHAWRAFETLRDLAAHLWSMGRWQSLAWIVWGLLIICSRFMTSRKFRGIGVSRR